MRLGVNGIVTDQTGRVLMIERSDTRTWAAPGGGVDAGESVQEALIREVREETGLHVWPVRLVDLHFVPRKRHGLLVLTFRCLLRGGEVRTSAESLRVGFVSAHPLPRRTLSVHRSRVENGLRHTGGPPTWGVHRSPWPEQLLWSFLKNVVWRWQDWRQQRRGAAPYTPPADWQAQALVVVRDGHGQVLWEDQAGNWRLPGAQAGAVESPWQCAERALPVALRLCDLAALAQETGAKKGRAIFLFSAETATPLPASPRHGWFAPGAEPPAADPQQCALVAAACDPGRTTTSLHLFES